MSEATSPVPSSLQDKAPKLPERPLWSLIHDWADENFSLQILGARRAFDMRIADKYLVYTAYRNGASVNGPGIVDADVSWTDFAGAGDRIRALFFNERRTKGHDVIVWRTMPEQEEDPKTGRRKLYFRCAFTSLERLRACAVGAARLAAAMPMLPNEPAAMLAHLDQAIKAIAPDLAGLIAAQLYDQGVRIEGLSDVAEDAIRRLSHNMAAGCIDYAAFHKNEAA